MRLLDNFYKFNLVTFFMTELENECVKHPVDFLGLNPEEFSEKFNSKNSLYIKSFAYELNRVYKKQAAGDRKRGRLQLSSGLDNLSTAFYMVYLESREKPGRTRDSIMGLRVKKLAEVFGETNYFYQRECFKKIGSQNSNSFELVLKAMNKVCNSCEKYLENPFE